MKTIEEKAEAYDEAYKRVAIRFGSNVADELFPELKESEDEKIRKWLICLLSRMQYHHCDDDREMGNKALAWLEKQGKEPTTIDADPVASYNNVMISDTKDEGIDDIALEGSVNCVVTNSNKQGEQKPYESSKNEKIDEDYKVGKWFTGLIPCWINAPSTLQPEHSNHGKNVVAIHLKGGGYKCCCIDDKKPRVFKVAENTSFEEGWHNRESSAWSVEDEAHINSIIDYLLDYKLLVCEEDMNVANGVQQELDWLKSLKEKM